MQGFICNANATTEIVATYGNGLLLEANTVDPKSRAMPQSCYLSHLDSCFLTWDSGKDHPMTGEATGQKLQVGGTSNLKHVSISLDASVTAPTAQTTAGKCYLWVLISDATGSPEIATARLHWADSRAGNH